jgi:hypothetical protein
MVSVAAPPKPSAELAKRIIDEECGQSLMFFKPYGLPVEFERTHKSMVRKLDKWVAFDLVSKSKVRFISEKMMYGSLREVSVGGFKYELNLDSAWVSDKGIFYGKPAVLEVLEISPPSHVSSDYFSEIYFSWYASNIPDWAPKIDLKEREHRVIKRAIESKKRPFEKRLYLIYRDNKWMLWDEKGKQSLF